MTNQKDVHRVLGLAVQVLKVLPNRLRPLSDLDDMRAILDGKDSGRDPIIIVEAVAVALAWRTQQIIERPLQLSGNEVAQAAHKKRLDELRALFQLVQRCDAWTFAVAYNTACDRLARAAEERHESA